ncbi:MAG: polymer-forming cytoskeletal protein [Desulfarculus sp.]|nr:polymer-forming cytoskeletal protein [Desulfarculus sp.]
MGKQTRENDLTMFLGGESQILGELIFTGQARLDGRFQGNIRGDGTLFIGPNAKVEALVNAATVIISGELVGDVVVTKRLELKTPGRLKGNITAPLVVMDEGVVFEGHCSMTTDQELDENRGRITLLSAKG